MFGTHDNATIGSFKIAKGYNLKVEVIFSMLLQRNEYRKYLTSKTQRL